MARAAPTPEDSQAMFLQALARMERAILNDLRRRATADVTETSDHTGGLKQLEERPGELHALLKQTREHAEWQREQALVAMTSEMRRLRKDLQSFVHVMAAAVVTLVVFLALIVLLRLG